MDLDEVRALIEAGETLAVEFKRGRRSDINDDQIVEAAACLANGKGGTLFLGVTDDGRISGLEPRHGSITDAAKLQAMILNRTEPPLTVLVEIPLIDNEPVAVIDVPASNFPIGTSGGRYLRRTLQADGTPQCMPYPLHAMLSQGHAARGSDYAATRARGISVRDLDPLEFERFRRFCGQGNGDRTFATLSDVEILRALRLLPPESPDEVTLGAVLLFGSAATIEKVVPTHEVIFHELKDGEILLNETLRAPLFQVAERVSELLSARNTQQELMLGLHRIGIPRIPEQVIREVLANALTHRDYAALGPVTVQLDEQQLRVSSPGGFPPGVTLENLLDVSRPRSPILSEAFKRAGIVDRAGRGINEIYRNLLRAGRGEPDYRQTTSEYVVVRIPASDSDLDLVRFIVDFENESNISLSLTELRVLHELRLAGPQSAAELSDELDSSVDVLRDTITKLSGRGLVESRGAGRGRTYSLTAAFYRRSGSDEYTHLRDTEPLQQEQLVLNYVEKFGSITRAKTASLCHLTSSQASSLLKKLRIAGKLELEGEKRGAKYKLPVAPANS